jgi:primary-amine oxidase
LVSRAHCANPVSQTFVGTTTWHFCFDAVSRFGLIIRQAAFRKAPTAPLVEILGDMRVAEIFVPYHSGSPRFFDISGHSFPLLGLSAADCPAPHKIIGGGKVCKEVRDRGLAWKKDGLVRRGKELVLWSVLDADNYNYVIEWSFRDDGSISGKAGSTGPKLGGANDTRGHMHYFSWRIDIDLNGPDGDSVSVETHREDLTVTPSTGNDISRPVAMESGHTWEARSFTVLKVVDSTLRNARNRQTAYHLQPLRTGTARHTEAHTAKDFWVTRYSNSELFAKNVGAYVDGDATTNSDIVLWYNGAAHHEQDMRDEDRDTVPILWTGFELVPSNMFERTPFFP